MAKKQHDTFLVHMNFERMFTSVTPDQCQRLVKAVFNLAKTGEIEDMSDDLVMDIFFQQIASFMIGNQQKYEDICAKRKEVAQQRWDEYRKYKEQDPAQNEAVEAEPTTPQEQSIFGSFDF